MSVDVVVPKIGLTVETVEVLAWRKAVGEQVTAGETIVELAADKADLEVEAPVAGTLLEQRAAAGDTVGLGDVLGVVGAPDGAGPPAADAAPRDAPQVAPDPVPAAVPTASPAATNGGRLRISPLARRVAADHAIDLATLIGSGPRGRIVVRDVESARSAPAPAAAPAAPDAPEPVAPAPLPSAPPPAPIAGTQEVRWTAARRATRRGMERSRDTVAPVTLHRRAPAELAMASVKRLKAAGLPATFSHAVLIACARTLPAHPALNALWDGDALLRSGPVHLGMAVDDGGDLLSAVLADAHDRDVTATVVGAVESVARARARERPTVAATFTVSNLGMFGVEQFTPIVDPPQVAVLGVGAVVDGRCHLSLTFDHRAVDGAPAARFLADVVTVLAAFDGR